MQDFRETKDGLPKCSSIKNDGRQQTFDIFMVKRLTNSCYLLFAEVFVDVTHLGQK